MQTEESDLNEVYQENANSQKIFLRIYLLLPIYLQDFHSKITKTLHAVNYPKRQKLFDLVYILKVF